MGAPKEIHQALSEAAEAVFSKVETCGGKSVAVAVIVTYQGEEDQETLAHSEGPIVPLLGAIDLTRFGLCKDASEGPDATYNEFTQRK